MLEPPLDPLAPLDPLSDGPSVPLELDALAEPDEDMGDSVALPDPLMDEPGPSVPSVLITLDCDPAELPALWDDCEPPLPPVGCWLVAQTGM